MPEFFALPNSPSQLLASIFIQETSPSKLLLVSGSSGAGKTHWCRQMVDAARLQGLTIAGLLSLPVFEQGRKSRIDLLDLQTGLQRILAVHRDGLGTGPVVGPWHFDPAVLLWGNEIIRAIQPCQLLILDELGPLEFEQNTGLTNALELIASRSCRLACVVVRPSLLPLALERWPWAESYFVPARQVVP